MLGVEDPMAIPRVFVLSNGTTISAPDGGGTGQVWAGLDLVAAVDVQVGDAISVGCGFHAIPVTEIDPA